jgi:hypothetical protein
MAATHAHKVEAMAAPEAELQARLAQGKLMQLAAHRRPCSGKLLCQVLSASRVDCASAFQIEGG